MIDLHSHILPGVDDGAPDIEASLAIAHAAVQDGIQVMACTPHFMPGEFNNESEDIRQRVAHLQGVLQQQGIPLELVTGCDAHIRPDLPQALREGRVLTINDTRYFLFEPPHITAPPRMDELLFNVTASGFVPVLTHPERLRWIESHYAMLPVLVGQGVLMQITAGSLSGRFGQRARYWAERMMNEGLIHILATDTHNVTSRPPSLADAAEIAAKALGVDEARNLVLIRPAMMLDNEPVSNLPALPAGVKPGGSRAPRSFWRRLFSSGA